MKSEGAVMAWNRGLKVVFSVKNWLFRTKHSVVLI